MALRRGFKTEANQTAAEIRAELGLGPLDRLDPRRLATHLEIPILELTNLTTIETGFECFIDDDTATFSAVTVFRGSRRGIVHNDTHVLGRQNSNISHEIAHGLLLHPPTPALDDTGCRNWNQDIEDEANWLAGVLLVPESVALHIASRGWPLAEAAERYEVSEEMIRWRLNMTGAHKRIKKYGKR